MTHGKNKKNFELLPAGQFIARVTQYILRKGLSDGALLWLVFQQGKRAAALRRDAETRGQDARKRSQWSLSFMGVTWDS
jgi:hypothetical protein